MSKPSDIPQDVMAAAEEAYQQAIYMTTSDEPQNMVLMVARAIMAERERCAKLIEANMLVGPDGVEMIIPRSNPGNKVGFAYAAAIRKGTP